VGCGGGNNGQEWSRDAQGKASIRKSQAHHRIKVEGSREGVDWMRSEERAMGQWRQRGNEGAEVGGRATMLIDQIAKRVKQ